jgi:hypothetical protein
MASNHDRGRDLPPGAPRLEADGLPSVDFALNSPNISSPEEGEFRLRRRSSSRPRPNAPGASSSDAGPVGRPVINYERLRSGAAASRSPPPGKVRKAADGADDLAGAPGGMASTAVLRSLASPSRRGRRSCSPPVRAAVASEVTGELGSLSPVPVEVTAPTAAYVAPTVPDPSQAYTDLDASGFSGSEDAMDPGSVLLDNLRGDPQSEPPSEPPAYPEDDDLEVDLQQQFPPRIDQAAQGYVRSAPAAFRPEVPPLDFTHLRPSLDVSAEAPFIPGIGASAWMEQWQPDPAVLWSQSSRLPPHWANQFHCHVPASLHANLPPLRDKHSRSPVPKPGISRLQEQVRRPAQSHGLQTIRPPRPTQPAVSMGPMLGATAATSSGAMPRLPDVGPAQLSPIRMRYHQPSEAAPAAPLHPTTLGPARTPAERRASVAGTEFFTGGDIPDVTANRPEATEIRIPRGEASLQPPQSWVGPAAAPSAPAPVAPTRSEVAAVMVAEELRSHGHMPAAATASQTSHADLPDSQVLSQGRMAPSHMQAPAPTSAPAVGTGAFNAGLTIGGLLPAATAGPMPAAGHATGIVPPPAAYVPPAAAYVPPSPVAPGYVPQAPPAAFVPGVAGYGSAAMPRVAGPPAMASFNRGMPMQSEGRMAPSHPMWQAEAGMAGQFMPGQQFHSSYGSMPQQNFAPPPAPPVAFSGPAQWQWADRQGAGLGFGTSTAPISSGPAPPPIPRPVQANDSSLGVARGPVVGLQSQGAMPPKVGGPAAPEVTRPAAPVTVPATDGTNAAAVGGPAPGSPPQRLPVSSVGPPGAGVGLDDIPLPRSPAAHGAPRSPFGFDADMPDLPDAGQARMDDANVERIVATPPATFEQGQQTTPDKWTMVGGRRPRKRPSDVEPPAKTLREGKTELVQVDVGKFRSYNTKLRPRRHHIRVLRHWQNEQVVYERRPGSALPTVSAVVLAKPVATAPVDGDAAAPLDIPLTLYPEAKEIVGSPGGSIGGKSDETYQDHATEEEEASASSPLRHKKARHTSRSRSKGSRGTSRGRDMATAAARAATIAAAKKLAEGTRSEHKSRRPKRSASAGPVLVESEVSELRRPVEPSSHKLPAKRSSSAPPEVSRQKGKRSDRRKQAVPNHEADDDDGFMQVPPAEHSTHGCEIRVGLDNGNWMCCDIRIPPRSFNTPERLVSNKSLLIHVMSTQEGMLDADIGGQVIQLNTGDSLVVRPDHEYCLRNRSDNITAILKMVLITHQS